MFYINELFLRAKYFLLSFFLINFLCYYYKNVLLILLSFSLLNSSTTNVIDIFSNFIYTHPTELLKIHFFLILFLSVLFTIPYLSWHILDFLKSSLTFNDYTRICRLLLSLIIFILLVNSASFFVLLPNIWSFFQNFNTLENASQTLKFFFELRVQEYFLFVMDFISLVNLFIALGIFLFLIISSLGIINLLYWKKLFIFINIVFATLLSPPDVYSQILILITLSIIFEILIFIFLYYLKLEQKFTNTA